MAILSVKESMSIKFIRKVINRIDDSVIDNYPKLDTVTVSLEDIEQNPLMLVRNIAVAAVNDRDWALPQQILGDVFAKLDLSAPAYNLHDENEVQKFEKRFELWIIMVDRVYYEAIKAGENGIIVSIIQRALQIDLNMPVEGDAYRVVSTEMAYLRRTLLLYLQNKPIAKAQADIVEIIYYNTIEKLKRLQYKDEELQYDSDAPERRGRSLIFMLEI
ncbi:hypothetical protein MKQ70_32260 [Chitinophaga sedimenti]|uniref:hypothetical protein n=1 Tax=Chitinophaga sedimenti TaxID=2033606 RepID=UPI002004E7EF|nr:hypothetical protein [Chitinophaga sedimenti]MCK7559392.1 hypothetical protein [Chitinophaga sedimenti]